MKTVSRQVKEHKGPESFSHSQQKATCGAGFVLMFWLSRGVGIFWTPRMDQAVGLSLFGPLGKKVVKLPLVMDSRAH